MYASRTTQFIVGIFAILGIAALAILSVSLGKISLIPAPGYTLYASFDNISGLKTGDQVQLDGVQIGKVVNIGLKDMRARVALRVNQGVEIDQDAIAAVKTSGIIGDKYISIALGPERKNAQQWRCDHAYAGRLRPRGCHRPANQQRRQRRQDKDKDKDKDKSPDSATAQKPAKPEK